MPEPCYTIAQSPSVIVSVFIVNFLLSSNPKKFKLRTMVVTISELMEILVKTKPLRTAASWPDLR